jgi:hypothetical protein
LIVSADDEGDFQWRYFSFASSASITFA